MSTTTRPRVLVTIPMFAEVLAHLGQHFEVDAPCGTATHIDWTPDTLAQRAQGAAGLLVAGTMELIRRWHRRNAVVHRDEVDRLMAIARSDSGH